LKIKVVAGASKSRVSGWLGEALKITVSAAPEKGKANKAVEAVICEALDIPIGSARIISGRHSPQKTVEIDGLSLQDIRQKLSGAG
jgi:hypothetical protein